jgi:hypothetical protein
LCYRVYADPFFEAATVEEEPEIKSQGTSEQMPREDVEPYTEELETDVVNKADDISDAIGMSLFLF